MVSRAVFSVLTAAWLALTAGAAFGAGVPQRDEIDTKYKWRLEDIYATNEAWEADFTRLEAMIPDLGRYQGRLKDDGKVLLELLRQRDEVRDLHERLLVYAGMRHDEDTRVDLYTAMRDRISSLGVRLDETLAYVEPELLGIPEETLWKMVEGTEGLGLYRQFLHNIVRARDHTLSTEVEELMASASEVSAGFSRTFGAFNNADVSYGTMKDEEGNEVELTKGLYRRFQESPDRRVREESWKLFYRAYEEFGRTLAANIAGNVKAHVFNSRARGYSSALEASLDRNAIPTDVYYNLINTVSENLEPLHRYAAMRKRVLGVEELQVWDMSAPLVDGAKKDIAFEDAVKIVSQGLQPLGEKYQGPFLAAFDQGWVDVYETEGKRSGAYSWGSYSTKPYLLLNYNGTMDAVFTLAHEMGHSLHSYFAYEAQPFVYGDYSIFVAEVASTTNEALLIEKMLSETEDVEERLVLLNHYLEQIRGTFFTQVMFAEVELRMHEMEEAGEPLTRDALDELYRETYKKYFGPAVNVVDLNGVTWSRIPHFYYNFYVYQYATSYAAATALATKILKEGEPAVESYFDFLEAGSSDYPIQVLARAGVDMTRPEPILATIDTFARILDQMEVLLDSVQ